MLFSPLRIDQRIAAVFIGAGVFIALWETALLTGVATPLLLPHVSEIARTLGRLMKTHTFWANLSATTVTWVCGVCLGVLAGGVSGLMLGLNRFVWAAFEPWIEFLRSLPSVILVPLVSLFLGVGFLSRLMCATLVVYVLMVSTAAVAVRAAKNSHLRLARTWRASKNQVVFHFYLPAVLAQMAVAMRAAVPIALIVTVAADMVVATDAGLGKLVLDSLAVLDTAKMYATILVVGIMGYASALLTSWLEKRAIHWTSS